MEGEQEAGGGGAGPPELAGLDTAGAVAVAECVSARVPSQEKGVERALPPLPPPGGVDLMPGPPFLPRPLGAIPCLLNLGQSKPG